VPRRPPPWWLRAYLVVGALQGLAIGLTGLLSPANVVGFPLETTPLNTRLVAAFYLAGAVGLALSAAARDVHDTRIFVAGFVLVTGLLLVSTLLYWSEFTAGGVPWPWLVSYILEPPIGVAALVGLGLLGPAEPGWRPWFLPLAVLLASIGLAMLLAPHSSAARAPWKVTPVLARVYAAILLAYALGFGLAVGERRGSALRPLVVSALVFLAGVTVVSIIHRDRFTL
jgi:hypothetical protein